MPAPIPFSPHNPQQLLQQQQQQQQQALASSSYPALYLYPLNDSFIPKHITLLNGQRVKIGRQTNAKTVPAERNGYFDSKVLSRQHAEVWEEGGKIYIKDVKSSNGTFINGERLSAEGLESEPYELKSDDIVEFGIDIVGEDNKTIIHHKVAARVVCVFSEQDAQNAARAEQQQPSSSYGVNVGGMGGGGMGQGQVGAGGGGGGAGFNFANQGPGAGQRRPMQQQGLGGMGGMGGNMRPPGKSGLTFDHILSRLQGELQKSRETGAELHGLTGAMNEVHDTLGGAVAPTHPPHPQSLPPVRPPSESAPSHPEQSSSLSEAALRELQSQLHDTQSSLANHVDKIRTLEGMLAEHDAIKREINTLRDMMEERKREMQLLRSSTMPNGRHHRRDEHEHEGGFESDDEDTRSIATITPHELERVDEEDEEQFAAEEEEEERERHRRREELGRPRTPEPTGMVEDEDELAHETKMLAPHHRRSVSPSHRDRRRSGGSPLVIPDELTQRLTTLSNQLESALELSRSLQAQHSAAQTTISTLESKVSALETLVQSTQAQVQAQEAARAAVEASREESASSSSRDPDHDSITEMLNEWKKNVEGQWSGVQEEWKEERDRLRRARDEWEGRVKAVEEGMGNAVNKMDAGLASLSLWQSQQHHHQGKMNGDARNGNGVGLVTPPSPRSLSSDSIRSRQRRKRNGGSRGRSRSQSVPVRGDSTNSEDSMVDSSSGELVGAPSSPKSLPRSPWIADDSSDSEGHTDLEGEKLNVMKPSLMPITPESSVIHHSTSTSASSSPDATTATTTTATDAKGLHPDMHYVQMSTAVGVLVLSVAAAAVIWRVKPE